MKLSKSFVLFLIAEMILTAGCLLVYVSVQQSYRNAANDPQIQTVSELKYKLSDSGLDTSVISKEKIELSGGSLSLFVIIYNSDKNPVMSSVLLNGKIPRIPVGVLQASLEKEINLVTWQPAKSLRYALAVVHSDGKFQGYIVCGRSLKSAEDRISQLNIFVILIWLAASIAAAVLTFIYSKSK
jgi:hypothetical protein